MYKGVIKRLFGDAHCLALANIQTRRGDSSYIRHRHQKHSRILRLCCFKSTSFLCHVCIKKMDSKVVSFLKGFVR